MKTLQGVAARPGTELAIAVRRPGRAGLFFAANPLAEDQLRIVLQRVSRASVRIDGQVVGAVGQGVCLLVGFAHADTPAQVDWMADKVAGLRIFADADGKMNLDLTEIGGAVLVVSQFTLYGDAAKGRRPSFVDAARPEVAIPLYEAFVAALRARGLVVETGRFGAMMDVEIHNDGPVTLILDRTA